MLLWVKFVGEVFFPISAVCCRGVVRLGSSFPASPDQPKDFRADTRRSADVDEFGVGACVSRRASDLAVDRVD